MRLLWQADVARQRAVPASKADAALMENAAVKVIAAPKIVANALKGNAAHSATAVSNR
jgi:hypothetical protein